MKNTAKRLASVSVLILFVGCVPDSSDHLYGKWWSPVEGFELLIRRSDESFTMTVYDGMFDMDLMTRESRDGIRITGDYRLTDDGLITLKLELDRSFELTGRISDGLLRLTDGDATIEFRRDEQAMYAMFFANDARRYIWEAWEVLDSPQSAVLDFFYEHERLPNTTEMHDLNLPRELPFGVEGVHLLESGVLRIRFDTSLLQIKEYLGPDLSFLFEPQVNSYGQLDWTCRSEKPLGKNERLVPSPGCN